MTTILEGLPPTVTIAEVAPVIESACTRIAPAWPLDRMIAVNPYWGFIGLPIEQAAAKLAALAGTRLLMPRSWYRAQWEAGRITARHLTAALALSGSARAGEAVIAELATETPAPLRLRLITDLVDGRRDLSHQMAWGEFVTRHLSQVCAACFDDGQARWTPERSRGLYPLWRTLAEADGGPRLLMGLRGFRAAVAALPEDPRTLIAEATETLAVPPSLREAWYTALLMTVPGWASACAFRRWEARLAGGDDAQLVHLLATRLAWELVLYRLDGSPDLGQRWSQVRRDWPIDETETRLTQRDDWVLQRALELSYQERLIKALARPPVVRAVAPTVQAVFCIDVRSEVFRRALEATDPWLETLGFAGFFGLPIAYAPPVGPARPQLPGLLAPSLLVRDTGAGADVVAARNRTGLERATAWKDWLGSATSTFSLVEVTGLGYAAALVRDGLWLGDPAGDPLRTGLADADAGASRPELAGRADGSGALDLEAKVDLAAGVLGGLSLTRGFARLLAVIGHGAGTVNNPQAAGLHCGACGGQTGEVNARALAALLNDGDVRTALAVRGIELPATTQVVAGLHNTTTDEVTLFDRDRLPASHREALTELERRLVDAGRRARSERAASLGLGELAGDALDAAVRRRAVDWSEVRPEWGLARNAAFVVAPRERTRGIDLGGRAFLHEYRWEQDAEFRVLELIMTAPMVVTHWINLQYYASTVDNRRYGSGNKVLHNVVGGRLGVFEGAGGDLRTGLALQSLHDGRDWIHEPLRLSVCIEAPAEAIDRVIAKHPTVRNLVAHEWLFLFRIDPATGKTYQRREDGWHGMSFMGC